MKTRPNILYIFTDQQSATAMSGAGNGHLHTPAMDRLAAEGVRFDNSYTAFPLCVPARTSMFTGRMPHEAGICDNHPERHAGLPFPMLGRLMADAGYACHYVGKWHIPSVPESDRAAHGFDDVVFGGGYGGLDSEKTEAALAYLRRPPPEPVFLVVSYNNPHDCCELSRGEDLRMGTIPPPPGINDLPPLPANFDVPEGEPECIRAFQRKHPRSLLANRWDERKTREYVWGYYRLVEMVDAEIGRLLEGLKEAGLDQDTAVIFSSDHGDGGGAHRWNQKWSLYDESARVPFIMAGAGTGAPGRTVATPVSATLDLMPTILDLAGIPMPEDCLGRSLGPVLEGRALMPPRQFVACETGLGNLAGDGGDMVQGRMIRTERYKYSGFDAGTRREQLVDMQEDPGEMINLVDDPGHADVLQAHRDHLRRWCVETHDDFGLEE
jgi:arylsulfatase A-like enzyme